MDIQLPTQKLDYTAIKVTYFSVANLSAFAKIQGLNPKWFIYAVGLYVRFVSFAKFWIELIINQSQ